MNLSQTIQYLQELGDALERATTKFMNSAPILTRQHMERLANQKLNTTKDSYISALKVDLVNSQILVVELDQENWMANAVESGVEGWDMKTTHLKSPKAKISAKGYKYMSIPMQKSANGKGGPTPYGQVLQQKIKQVLMNKPAFGAKQTKTLYDGRVVEQQKLLMDSDPMLKGFYRVRSHDSFDDYHKNKNSRKSWQYILFRTMSENPESKSQWKHPGIKPVHIFRDTENWLTESIPALANSVYSSEIDALNKKFGGG